VHLALRERNRIPTLRNGHALGDRIRDSASRAVPRPVCATSNARGETSQAAPRTGG
jgi:hypothetical protein